MNIVKEILTTTESIKATLVDVVCHRFSPYGVTGVAILAESHISVHTRQNTNTLPLIFLFAVVLLTRMMLLLIWHSLLCKRNLY